MAEEKPAGKASGWFKAVVTSVFGLLSGAVLMYLTPLVNNVIKPGKPVPNFAQQTTGLTVSFSNRSTGGVQGWWDFGDGSVLEPYEPAKDTVTHTYARPGTYNVKLSLQNLLGEESERVVMVSLENNQQTGPSIEAFAVVPVSPNSNAPATFKIISQVKNAKLVAWDLGDEKLKTESNPSPEKYITLREPGWYKLRLVAFNGDQMVEKSETVTVGVGDSIKPMATLKVVYEGAQVEQKPDRQTVVLGWDPKVQGPICPVSRELTVPQGWLIADAKYEQPNKELIRNLKPEVSPDRTRLKMSGEMVKPKNLLTGKNVPPPQCGVRVDLTLVRRTAASRTSDAVAFELDVPGSTTLPLPPAPAGLEVQKKRITLEIKDGQQMVWNQPGLPSGAQVAVKGRPLRVSAFEQTGQVRIDIQEVKAAVPVSRPLGK